MRIIKYSPDEFERLYCPSTEEVIFSIGREVLNFSAKAVIGYWNNDGIKEPKINDKKLKASWDDYFSKFSVGDKIFEWDDLLQFLADYNNPDWIVFDCSYNISIAGTFFFCFVVKSDTVFEDDPDFENEEDEEERD